LKILRARGFGWNRRRAINWAIPARTEPFAMAGLVRSASAATAIPRPGAASTRHVSVESVSGAFGGIIASVNLVDRGQVGRGNRSPAGAGEDFGLAPPSGGRNSRFSKVLHETTDNFALTIRA